MQLFFGRFEVICCNELAVTGLENAIFLRSIEAMICVVVYCVALVVVGVGKLHQMQSSARRDTLFWWTALYCILVTYRNFWTINILFPKAAFAFSQMTVVLFL
ncbi:hypothetical protein Tcan_01116, partial [Toxocara canis]